jgi:AAA+ ATPase superfamily predicted ATPase
MSSNWKSPKVIIGPVATGEYFFPRTEITEEIWVELEKGNFILIAAPRRVGKTSVMRSMEEEPRSGYHLVFKNVQGVNSEAEFYKEIYILLRGQLSQIGRIKSGIEKFLSSISLKGFNPATCAISLEEKEIDFAREVEKLILYMMNEEEVVVLLIDELPEVLHRMNLNGKTSEAAGILNSLRAWRQNGSKSLRLVLAGSIGIHYVVRAIEGRTKSINDLRKVQCHALSKEEVLEYIMWATQNASAKYSEECSNYLLGRLGAFITPFHLNLMLDEIDRLKKKSNENAVALEDIDEALKIIGDNNDYFSDWRDRLREYMPKEHFAFVNEVLTHIAHNNDIDIADLYNKSVKHNLSDDFVELIANLQDDGYIVEIKESEKRYTFTSPFLQAYWKRHNPIYNG